MVVDRGDSLRVEAGVRGMEEDYQRFTRLRVDTSGSGSLSQGLGATVVRNGTGDVTLTYTRAFPAIPVVTVGGEGSSTEEVVITIQSNLAASVRLVRRANGVAADGIINVIVDGRI